MGTRAYIGIKNKDGKVTAIYNHSNGGLRNLGHILNKYFNTEEKVRELIDFGYISNVEDNATYNDMKRAFKTFDEKQWKPLNNVPKCKVHLMPVYESAEEFDNINDVMGGMICYAYLFIPDENKWYYTKGKELKPLKA